MFGQESFATCCMIMLHVSSRNVIRRSVLCQWTFYKFKWWVRWVKKPFSQKFCRAVMDLRKVAELPTDQLIALALAVLCEFSRRLSIPLTVSADIGDSSATNVDPASTEAASSGHAGPTETPAPTTPSGASRPNQCCHGCGIPQCPEYCDQPGLHDRHRCAYHSWY